MIRTLTCLITCQILLQVIVYTHVKGQNLFPNPDFELQTACPTGYNQWNKMLSWSAGNAASPDYFNCSYYGISVQGSPSQGSGVVGFWGGANHPSCPGSGYSENIVANLAGTMGTGLNFTISFDLQVDGNGFTSAPPNECMDVGFYFYASTNPPGLSGYCCPGFSPQILVPGEMLQQGTYQNFQFNLTATDNWDKVLIGSFCNNETSGSDCSNYASKKMYFNLDNLYMEVNQVLEASLESFWGEWQQGAVQLNWLVSGQEELDYFELEYQSEPGSMQWEAFASIEVDPNDSIYQYMDQIHYAPFQQYRLKWVGMNGEIGHSSILSMSRKKEVEQAQIIPNPANDRCQLVLKSLSRKSYQIALRDLSGKSLWNHQAEMEMGINQVELELTGLSAGYYVVHIQSASGDFDQKLQLIKY